MYETLIDIMYSTHNSFKNSKERVQPLLKIGTPNDRYERQADAVADKVMQIGQGETMQMQPLEEEEEMMQPKLRLQPMEEEEEMLQPKIRMQPIEEEEEMMQMQPMEEEEEWVQPKLRLQPMEEEEEMLQPKIRMQPLEEEEEESLQMKPPGQNLAHRNQYASDCIDQKINNTIGSGKTLPDKVGAEMGSKIGSDFSRVRIHTGSSAIQMNRELGAQAFTHGRDIYFNSGKYNPSTFAGKHLLAHELTHVVQQSTKSISNDGTNKIQRGVLEGIDDQCIDYAGRDLRTRSSNSSPLPPTQSSGGTVQPGTEGTEQNCAGVSLCNRTEWVNWPYLGLEASDGSVPDPRFVGNWDTARYFVPEGCTFVNSSGVSTNATRCHPSEHEIIVFLYRWPVGNLPGTSIQVYRSDFHMIGRDCSTLPRAWESKMDRRERVENIQDPWQSLYDAYPHTRNSDREIHQLTFCCNCDMVATS